VKFVAEFAVIEEVLQEKTSDRVPVVSMQTWEEDSIGNSDRPYGTSLRQSTLYFVVNRTVSEKSACKSHVPDLFLNFGCDAKPEMIPSFDISAQLPISCPLKFFVYLYPLKSYLDILISGWEFPVGVFFVKNNTLVNNNISFLDNLS
jgi:hypothetical protein